MLSYVVLSCRVLTCLVVSCVAWRWRRVVFVVLYRRVCARLYCFGGALCSLILYYGFLCCLALHVVAKSIGMIFQFEFVLPEIRNASIEQVTS